MVRRLPFGDHMRLLWTHPLAICLCVITMCPLFAQSPVPSKQGAAAKRFVESLPAQSQISVIPRTGEEEFGTLISHSDKSFTFHDVDRNVDMTMMWEAVKKVKRGYGGYNHAVGRHVDHRKALVVTVVVLGVLAATIGAAAAAR